MSGFGVRTATRGEEALQEVSRSLPSAIVLDLGLPDIPGLEVCRVIKTNNETAGIPLVVFTGKDKEGQQAVSKNLGADAYVLKGCSMEALFYCVKGLLEIRSSCLPPTRLSLGPVTLDPDNHRVTVARIETPQLTPHEFSLLALLMKESPKVLPWNVILEKVWGLLSTEPLYKAPNRSMLCLKKLRHKLGPAGDTHLRTYRNQGLMFLPAK